MGLPMTDEEKVKVRNLTEDDVQALSDELEKRLTTWFYQGLGRGLWGVVWKGVLLALLAFAAAGSFKGVK